VLLNFLAVLDFVHKDFGRLEAWNKVFIDYDGGVAGNVACNFLLTLLIDEASEATNINIMAVGHIGLYNIEKSFNTCRYISFVDACFF